jgi:hypothetical protein
MKKTAREIVITIAVIVANIAVLTSGYVIESLTLLNILIIGCAVILLALYLVSVKNGADRAANKLQSAIYFLMGATLSQLFSAIVNRLTRNYEGDKILGIGGFQWGIIIVCAGLLVIFLIFRIISAMEKRKVIKRDRQNAENK